MLRCCLACSRSLFAFEFSLWCTQSAVSHMMSQWLFNDSRKKLLGTACFTHSMHSVREKLHFHERNKTGPHLQSKVQLGPLRPLRQVLGRFQIRCFRCFRWFWMEKATPNPKHKPLVGNDGASPSLPLPLPRWCVADQSSSARRSRCWTGNPPTEWSSAPDTFGIWISKDVCTK